MALMERIPTLPDEDVRRRSSVAVIAVIAVVVGSTCVAVGLALLVSAYSDAKMSTSHAHYHLFWAGLLLALAPLVAWVVRSHSATGTYLALAAVGAVSYAPRFLRSPDQPLLYDELGHWLQAQRLAETGKLFEPNSIVSMAKYYPGLHVVVAGLQQVTRVSTYRSGTVLILLFHVLSLWGVFELVRTLRPGSERAAGIAAVVYALSPTYSFFNAQLAYQTMAVPFVIWTFVFVALYLRTDAPSRTRAIHGTMAAGCGAIVAVTHHLSGLVVSALLLVALVALLAKRGARPTRRDLALLVGVALLPLLWAAAVRAPVVSYLRPYPERGWHELAQRVGVEDKPAAGIGQGNTVPRSDRQLFGGSELPGYERAAAFAAPVLALGFAALALRRRRWTPVDCVVVVLAAGYFLSLPLVYTATGAQGAHRSWAFSYVGLAVLMGLGIARFQAARSVPRWLASLVVSATLVTLLVGNYAAENNDRVRFPGPFTFLADGRGVTDELRGLAERFRAEEGDGKRVISDVLTGSVLASYGRATYLRDYPSWEVFYPTAPLDEEQHQALLRAGVYAVVVDRRLAVYERARAFYFSDSEPANPGVLPEASVAKFGSTRWLRARYRTANYEIYVVEGSS